MTSAAGKLNMAQGAGSAGAKGLMANEFAWIWVATVVLFAALLGLAPAGAARAAGGAVEPALLDLLIRDMTEAAGGEFDLSTAEFRCKEYGFKKDITWQSRKNARTSSADRAARRSRTATARSPSGVGIAPAPSRPRSSPITARTSAARAADGPGSTSTSTAYVTGTGSSGTGGSSACAARTDGTVLARMTRAPACASSRPPPRPTSPAATMCACL